MTSLPWTSWVDVLAQPQAVRSLFVDTSSFAGVDLFEISIDRQGPVLRLRFSIPIAPSSPPKRWQKGANATQFVLAAWHLDSVEVQGFGWEVPGELTGAWMSDSRETLALRFAGPACRIHAVCRDLRVERIADLITAIASPNNASRMPIDAP